MRDIVVFPTNMTPIVVGRKESLNLVRMLEKKPDTNDWSTVAENGKMGLNGDILMVSCSGSQFRAQFYGYPCRQGESAASA